MDEDDFRPLERLKQVYQGLTGGGWWWWRRWWCSSKKMRN